VSGLKGKVALITGAARGQGRSHALRLAAEGVQIIGIDLCAPIDSVAYPLPTPADLADTVRQVEALDVRMLSRTADVRDPEALRDAVQAGVQELGRIDIVLANAGILPVTGAQGKTHSAFTDAVDINLTGVFNTIEAVLPALLEQEGGCSIVITSSTVGMKGVADGSAGSLGYVAAKTGVIGLMRAYAVLLAEHSIRVNCVVPTGANTPMSVNEQFAEYLKEHEDMTARLQNAMPVPLIEPIDISNAIAWLCSDEARYVTGVALPVDAGFLVR
jgi:SDR family mycofactocin-dependent oxidoreductase